MSKKHWRRVPSNFNWWKMDLPTTLMKQAMATVQIFWAAIVGLNCWVLSWNHYSQPLRWRHFTLSLFQSLVFKVLEPHFSRLNKLENWEFDAGLNIGHIFHYISFCSGPLSLPPLQNLKSRARQDCQPWRLGLFQAKDFSSEKTIWKPTQDCCKMRFIKIGWPYFSVSRLLEQPWHG